MNVDKVPDRYFVSCRYFSAQAGNCVLNIILKTLASTPRPHFFSSCQPDWSLIDCHHNQGFVFSILNSDKYTGCKDFLLCCFLFM